MSLPNRNALMQCKVSSQFPNALETAVHCMLFFSRLALKTAQKSKLWHTLFQKELCLTHV